MKTFWKICFIALGIFIFLGGCAIDRGAMIIQFFGAIILMVGLIPMIDKDTFTTKKNDK